MIFMLIFVVCWLMKECWIIELGFKKFLYGWNRLNLILRNLFIKILVFYFSLILNFISRVWGICFGSLYFFKKMFYLRVKLV